MQFSKHSSGAFGEETPGEWMPRDELVERFLATVRRQSLRVQYTARGRVLGIPVSFVHKPLRAIYNNGLVTRVRTWSARRRGVEAGGLVRHPRRTLSAAAPILATRRANLGESAAQYLASGE